MVIFKKMKKRGKPGKIGGKGAPGRGTISEMTGGCRGLM
jgi:hypothetical protein